MANPYLGLYTTTGAIYNPYLGIYQSGTTSNVPFYGW